MTEVVYIGRKRPAEFYQLQYPERVIMLYLKILEY
jgi:hypothetical protein